MPFYDLSPNMGLHIPEVGVDPGPDWATQLNNSLTLIDQHDHTSGHGVLITPRGLDINSNLTFNNNPASSLLSASFIIQPASSVSALVTAYSADTHGNLWWNDADGNRIQITESGTVVGVVGNITNLVLPAAVTWFPLSKTLVFTADTSPTPMILDAGSIIVRDLITPFNGVTIGVTSLAAPYNLFLPAALPPVQSFMTLDNAGQISAPWTVDSTTIKIVANHLAVQVDGATLDASGAGGSLEVAAGGINTAQIANGAVTRPKLAAVGQQISGSSGGADNITSTSLVDCTNLNVTITTSGRPVMLFLQGDGTASASEFALSGTAAAKAAIIVLLNGVTAIHNTALELTAAANNITAIPPGSFLFMDTPAAGTYTYKVQAKVSGAGMNFNPFHVVLVAYEL